jgi:hypothetical protein
MNVMDCKSATVQGYASHTTLIQHKCNLPHTGMSLLWIVAIALLIIAVGVALRASR